MKTARFVSPAEREMLQAAQYYNSKVPNLGAEFLHEVKVAVYDRLPVFTAKSG